MKKLTCLFLLCVPISLFAQGAEEKEVPKDGWTKGGNISLLFSQAAFNEEWTGGGTSNYAANLNLTYDFNYRKGPLVWDNRIIADYGVTKTKEQEFTRKTNDRLELNSVLGKQIKETNWYYSYFLNFKTQFTSGYEYGEDVNDNEIRTETTKFLSPGYLQTGPGLLWKKNDDLSVNISPATAKLIFVDNAFTSLPGYEDGDYFGVDMGESTRFEFGASINGYAKFDIMKNVTVENILNLYSNYLEDPQNIDIDYTLNLIMAVNKFITANATFQAIYDDNAVQAFQIREALGIGVTYGF
ncbi:DUF3078 domain-containing protein [Altibacter lentus]|uniref:DUF3078 domain-containing protein n=1 Tax=Altibacter lentus TaxID=1223410 RepID=UPI000554157C|nr:DUF3078 domain-containing protein [Altibacter lentus]